MKISGEMLPSRPLCQIGPDGGRREFIPAEMFGIFFEAAFADGPS